MSKRKESPELERRYVPMSAAEVRVEEVDGQEYLVGHAAVFNSWSEDLGGFRERIAPKAFADVLAGELNVVFVPDHRYEVEKLLGRTASGTLKLAEDDVGLAFRAPIPDTQTGRNVKAVVKRGDADGMSFAFYLREDDGGLDRWWEEDGQVNREILRVSELVDIAVVTHPAYPAASVAISQRCLDAAGVFQRKKTPIQRLKRELDLLRLMPG